MPKLWEATIDAHRRQVRDALIDTTAELVAERGLRSVTMSEVAAETGIGRATLYKYFKDVDAILVAWHEREINSHLAHLTKLRDGPGDPITRLDAMLAAYAAIQHEHHGSRLAVLLHGGEHVVRAQLHLTELIGDLIHEGADIGVFRDDVPAGELARYCVHALAAASQVPSKAAVHRLVAVTLDGLGRAEAPVLPTPRSARPG